MTACVVIATFENPKPDRNTRCAPGLLTPPPSPGVHWKAIDRTFWLAKTNVAHPAWLVDPMFAVPLANSVFVPAGAGEAGVQFSLPLATYWLMKSGLTVVPLPSTAVIFTTSCQNGEEVVRSMSRTAMPVIATGAGVEVPVAKNSISTERLDVVRFVKLTLKSKSAGLPADPPFAL